MKMNFADSELEYELLDGEYRRYVEENGDEGAEYLCIGLFGSNKIFFQYIDTIKEPVDFVESVISNIPEFALDYLVNLLNETEDMLVRATFYPGSPTGYEVYYNCDCESNEISNLIEWMANHNDFAAVEYRYTEIIDGHQKCIGA